MRRGAGLCSGGNRGRSGGMVIEGARYRGGCTPDQREPPSACRQFHTVMRCLKNSNLAEDGVIDVCGAPDCCRK